MRDEDRKLLFLAGRLGKPVAMIAGIETRELYEHDTVDDARESARTHPFASIYQRESDGTWTEVPLVARGIR